MDIQRNVKNKSETADTERIGFLHSLKAKILLLVAAAVVLVSHRKSTMGIADEVVEM